MICSIAFDDYSHQESGRACANTNFYFLSPRSKHQDRLKGVLKPDVGIQIPQPDSVPHRASALAVLSGW